MKREQSLAILCFLLLSPVAFSQNLSDMNADMIGLIQTMEPLAKIMSVMMLVVGIMAGIARQNLMSFFIGIAGATALNNMPDIMYGMLGVEPQETQTDTNLIGGIIAWFADNWLLVAVGFFTLIAESVLINRAVRQFKFYRQETITNHWKSKLLTELEHAVNKLEDYRILDRFNDSEEKQHERAQEQKTISDLVQKLHKVKCFEHPSQPSLVSFKRKLYKGRNAFTGCSGRSLESFRETLKSMPDNLEDARKQMNKKPVYDDLLREQVAKLNQKEGFFGLSLSKAK